MDPAPTAPLVSVLTTSYNHARWLSDTLDFVQRQGYPHVEHIVVDDGSTDSSTDLLSAAAGRGLCWSSTQHVGQAGALNEAFRRSTGQIIGWLSSDDAYYDREVIGQVVKTFARHPSAGVVYGHAVLVDEAGLQLHAEWVPPPAVLGRHPPIQIYQPAAFVRRSAIDGDFVDEFVRHRNGYGVVAAHRSDPSPRPAGPDPGRGAPPSIPQVLPAGIHRGRRGQAARPIRVTGRHAIDQSTQSRLGHRLSIGGAGAHSRA